MQTEYFFIGSVFLAGIVSFFSPCILPVLPAYAGILMDQNESRVISVFGYKLYTKPIFKTLAFIMGLSVAFFMLAITATAVSQVLSSPYIPIVMGIIVMILGAHQAELISFTFLYRQKTIFLKQEQIQGYFGAFLLGFSFSFGWTPCIGPILSSILVLATSNQSNAFGFILIGVYALGLAIPFLVMSLASSFVLEQFLKVRKHLSLIKKMGGILIMIMGLLLALGQFNLLQTIIY